MHHLWIRVRLPFAIVVLLVINLTMARLFSGPEDTWIKNDRGEWIKHGYPSGSPPPQDYQEPLSQTVIPFLFFLPIIVPLFLIKRHTSHQNMDSFRIASDIRFYGYISMSLFLVGTILLIGLIVEIGFGFTGDIQLQVQELLTVISIGFFAVLCIFISYICFLQKRKYNNQYQL